MVAGYPGSAISVASYDKAHNDVRYFPGSSITSLAAAAAFAHLYSLYS